MPAAGSITSPIASGCSRFLDGFGPPCSFLKLRDASAPGWTARQTMDASIRLHGLSIAPLLIKSLPERILNCVEAVSDSGTHSPHWTSHDGHSPSQAGGGPMPMPSVSADTNTPSEESSAGELTPQYNPYGPGNEVFFCNRNSDSSSYVGRPPVRPPSTVFARVDGHQPFLRSSKHTTRLPSRATNIIYSTYSSAIAFGLCPDTPNGRGSFLSPSGVRHIRDIEQTSACRW